MPFAFVTAEDYLLGANLFHFGFCIFLIGFMRIALSNQNNSFMRIWFKRFVIVALFSVFFDMLSYVFDMQSYPGARVGNQVAMFLAVLSTALVGSLWNRFFDIIFRIENYKVRRWIVYLIPSVLTLIMLINNIFTGHVYTIGEDNFYTRGHLYWLSFSLQYISFVLVIIRALVFNLEVKTLRRRRMRNGILWLGLLTLAFGILQALTNGKLALHCLGMTTGIFIMFVRLQDEQITQDTLTTLHNRYSLDSYLTEKLKDYPSGKRRNYSLYYVMMDVDDFKQVNDMYGHNEGDELLRAIAFQLKKVGVKYKTDLFIARYAGDEFSAIFETDRPDKVEQLKNDIKVAVSELSRGRDHEVTISVGYAAYAGKKMSMETLFELADKALYIDKYGAKLEKINDPTSGYGQT